MSLAISSGTPWDRRAMLTREGTILSKQAVAPFSIMASEMRVRWAISHISSFCRTTLLAERPGLPPAWASPNMPCCSPYPHEATGDNDFDEKIQVGFEQVNDTETVELGRPSVFLEHRSDYVLPSM